MEKYYSVDLSESVSFGELFYINTSIGSECLNIFEFRQIYVMNVGDVLTFGMGIEVKRVK